MREVNRADGMGFGAGWVAEKKGRWGISWKSVSSIEGFFTSAEFEKSVRVLGGCLVWGKHTT